MGISCAHLSAVAVFTNPREAKIPSRGKVEHENSVLVRRVQRRGKLFYLPGILVNTATEVFHISTYHFGHIIIKM